MGTMIGTERVRAVNLTGLKQERNRTGHRHKVISRQEKRQNKTYIRVKAE